jgi:hypothetical protein
LNPLFILCHKFFTGMCTSVVDYVQRAHLRPWLCK